MAFKYVKECFKIIMAIQFLKGETYTKMTDYHIRSLLWSPWPHLIQNKYYIQKPMTFLHLSFMKK